MAFPGRASEGLLRSGNGSGWHNSWSLYSVQHCQGCLDVFLKPNLTINGEIPITLLTNAVYPTAEVEVELSDKGVCLNNAQISSWMDYYTAFVFP